MNARRKAFTLVELLVVIIIIGILAAVAIPQFGSSSEDAKVAALKENLRTMRSAIEKYYIEHNNVYPGIVKTHRATGAGSAAAHTSTEDAFVKQLTMYSDANGNTCAEMHSSFPFKPYLKSGVPANPLPAAGAVADPAGVNVVTDTTPLTADGSATKGWKFSSARGDIIANNSTYQSF